jgi:ribosomal protein S18 acetylase RimI-like enzyme
MKLVRWTRFTWNLAKLPGVQDDLGPHFSFRPARDDEQEAVWTVAQRSFLLDADWSDTFKIFSDHLETRIEETFLQKENHCLVLTHGSRIIGVSVLCMQQESDNQLISGPCILTEYRSRGLGTALLGRSLLSLREGGLDQAHGVTRQNGTAAKFVYSKFNSTSVPFDLETQLVGAAVG